MYIKILKSLLLLPFCLSFTPKISKKATTESPIELEGHCDMVELGKHITIQMKAINIHPFANVQITIYANNIIDFQNTIISKEFNNRTYGINATYNKNDKIDVKIIVGYPEVEVEDTICNFTYVSPEYGSRKVLSNDYTFKSNPTSIDFHAKGSSYQVDYNYEEINVAGNISIDMKDTRFLDLSNFYIKLDDIFDLNEAEVRIYYKFDDSDLLYKNNYTTFDLELTKLDDNTYHVENEYKFFIDSQNGNIYESNYDYTDNEALPFFFPISVGNNERINFDIYFNDVGKNHTNYAITGYINLGRSSVINNNKFGHILDYKYCLIDMPIQGVEYHA